MQRREKENFACEEEKEKQCGHGVGGVAAAATQCTPFCPLQLESLTIWNLHYALA